jgi:uncharacterized protein (TIGR02594 family)
MNKILEIAFSQLGIEEIPRENDNPQIIKYASETNIVGITNDEIAWCSSFVNWCAKQAGLQYSGKPNARSWLNVGLKTTHPEPGDVAVFWREDPQSWEGHVALFLGFSDDLARVFVIGGNQGNRVSVSAYRKEKVLSFQRLTEMKQAAAPNPVLKRGDRGAAVVQLQDSLKIVHIEAGLSDGSFGPTTEKAVKELQSRKPGLAIDGIYNEQTRELLESLLQQ